MDYWGNSGLMGVHWGQGNAYDALEPQMGSHIVIWPASIGATLALALSYSLTFDSRAPHYNIPLMERSVLPSRLYGSPEQRLMAHARFAS